MYESFWKFGYNSYNDDDDDAFGYGKTNERMKKKWRKKLWTAWNFAKELSTRRWQGKERQGKARKCRVREMKWSGTHMHTAHVRVSHSPITKRQKTLFESPLHRMCSVWFTNLLENCEKWWSCARHTQEKFKGKGELKRNDGKVEEKEDTER